MDNFIKWSEADLEQISSALKGDQVVLSECDTVLGLFTLANQEGFNSLNKIKERKDKPYLMVVSSLEEIEKFSDCNFSEQLYRLVNYCWPGPLTLILKARDDAPDYLKSVEGTVAVRIPKHDMLLELLALTGPLFSTSANIAGQLVPKSFEEVNRLVLEQVNLVIGNSTGAEYSTVPSTILDCSNPDKIVLVREGAYNLEILEQVSGGKILR